MYRFALIPTYDRLMYHADTCIGPPPIIIAFLVCSPVWNEGEPRSDKWNGMLSKTEDIHTDGRKNYAHEVNSGKSGNSDSDLHGTGP